MMPAQLPEGARNKLTALNLQRLAAQDAAGSANARLNGLPRDADQGLQAQLLRERDKHQDRFRQLSLLVNRLNEWVMQVRVGAVLEPVQVVNIRLKPNEPLTAALAKVRNQIRDTREQLGVVKSAPLPSEDQAKAAAAFVVKLARQARPTVAVMRDDTLRVAFRDSVIASTDDALALACWLDPESVLSALTRELEAMPRPIDPMSASERLQKVAELEKTLASLEFHEEALIQHAAGDGLDVLRRPDASPSAVLGITIAKAQAAQVA
jgi:hypothetical protein